MVSREEFERLLDEYTALFGAAVYAQGKTATEYRDATEKAVEARDALLKAVFP
jgi:hypothetical protein